MSLKLRVCAKAVQDAITQGPTPASARKILRVRAIRRSPDWGGSPSGRGRRFVLDALQAAGFGQVFLALPLQPTFFLDALCPLRHRSALLRNPLGLRILFPALRFDSLSFLLVCASFSGNTLGLSLLF
ncbi:hypothetical protein ACRAWG_35180 [Methylobacterium sp. P31]